MKNLIKSFFKNWKIIDYIFIALSIIAVSIVTTRFHLPVFSAVIGVFLVVGMASVLKNNLMGYVLAGVALVLWCFNLKQNLLFGDLILTAGLLLPLLVFRILALYINKLGEKTKLNKWDFIIVIGLAAVAIYPFYLLMSAMQSYMPIVEAINLLLMCVIFFLQIRNQTYSKHLFLIIWGLQLFNYIYISVQVDQDSVCVLAGLFFAFVLQAIYSVVDLVRFCKTRKNSKNAENIEEKHKKIAKNEQK